VSYILANTGRYDVWHLNARGSRYSKQHNFLDAASSTEYWQFSFDEQALYDLEAIIDYVLWYTGKSKVTLIGYS
jgi:hypothetical protein